MRSSHIGKLEALEFCTANLREKSPRFHCGSFLPTQVFVYIEKHIFYKLYGGMYFLKIPGSAISWDNQNSVRNS